MSEIHLEGSCLCGNIQFVTHEPNKWCANCHCTRCQRSHGTGFVTWIGVNGSAVKIIENSVPLNGTFHQNDPNTDFAPPAGLPFSIGQKNIRVRLILHLPMF